MDFAAFLSLEDITEALPSYREEVLAVEMDGPLREAYEKLEDDIKEALKAYRGNQSVLSVSMNALLLYPDKPFGLGDLTAFAIQSGDPGKGAYSDIESAGSGRPHCVCKRAAPGGRSQVRTEPGTSVPDLRCLHAEARRHTAAEGILSRKEFGLKC